VWFSSPRCDVVYERAVLEQEYVGPMLLCMQHRESENDRKNEIYVWELDPQLPICMEDKHITYRLMIPHPLKNMTTKVTIMPKKAG